MRTALIAALALFGSINAHAYTYSSGQATLSKPLMFQDANGAPLKVTSGSITLKLGGRPLWGADTIQIKTIQGTIAVQVPRANYTNGWDFTLPAGKIPYALRGSSTDRVNKADARDVVQQCSMSPIQLPITDSNGQPVMEHRTDAQGQPLPDAQLVVNLCASSTNGKIDLKQTSALIGCSGSQHVLMQQVTTTPVYTIDIIDPSSGDSLGKIEASSSSTSDDVKVKDVTSCIAQ